MNKGINHIKNRATHAAKLERWLGVETVEHLAGAMRDWYGPPIAVDQVPGAVWVTKGGDFRGPIEHGHYYSLLDDVRARWRMIVRSPLTLMLASFSGVSDAIAEYSAGKFIEWGISKVGTTGVAGATNSLWRVGNQPAAGAAASAAPGGIAPTDATTGALLFTNPTGGDTQHFLRADMSASAINTLLLYDRIFAVAKTMNSTATESVTGVPTRYQSSTPNTPDYAGGNFLFVECGTALPATAHNWTTCLYRDDAGNDSQTLPSVTGNSSNIINRLDQPTSTWFCPLATGDVGIMDLAQMQCSAAVATGAIDFVIGHPIAFIPCPIANLIIPTDGMRNALKMTRIFDDAALALLEITKPATAATTYGGTIASIYG